MKTSAWGRIVLALSVASVFAFSASTAFAAGAPAVVVEAVQMPAWVERAGAQPVPVYPGMELKANDQVKTGVNSRLLLRTPDGSSVKLGEKATYRLGDVQMRPGNVFAASMSVFEGAFRFTTDTLQKFRGKREVSITVSTVTAGIRGTDLWGKSSEDKQIVCLIEGKIDVTPQGEAPIVMDQALQFYVREKGKSLPVGAVDPAQLKQWATETEIATGTGAARRGGHWKVTLATADDQVGALKLYDAFRAAGYPAVILPAGDGDKSVYRLRLINLPSKAEAEALAGSLKGKMGIDAPRVSM